jgi:hypothetical protein
LQNIAKTLEEIDALHKQFLRRGGGAARDEFLARRQTLFAKLDAQMRSFARYGTGLRNEGSIKKMLGISTKSYLHSGEIKRYSETITRVSKTAKTAEKRHAAGHRVEYDCNGVGDQGGVFYRERGTVQESKVCGGR